jgi:hypothetical protein
MIRSAAIGAFLLMGAQCSPAASNRSDATTPSPTFVEDRSASIDRTQLCSPGTGDGSYPKYPNGFLVVWTPSPHDFGTAPERWVRNVYRAEAVPQVVKFYNEYNTIVAPTFDLFTNRDVAGLRNSFRKASALARQVAKEAPRPANPGLSGGPSGVGIEYEAPALALNLAYIILTLDQDYAAFSDRAAAVLKADPLVSEVYQFRKTGPTTVGKPRYFVGTSTGALRALVIFHLLMKDYDAAENTMLFLIETSALSDPRDYYGQYGARELADHLRANAVALDTVVFDRVDRAPETGRCSDLAALYIEWLDFASRAARFTGDETLAGRVQSEARRVRSEIPKSHIASKHEETMRSIENRIARGAGRRS